MDYVEEYIKIEQKNLDVDKMSKEEYCRFDELRQKAKVSLIPRIGNFLS